MFASRLYLMMIFYENRLHSFISKQVKNYDEKAICSADVHFRSFDGMSK